MDLKDFWSDLNHVGTGGMLCVDTVKFVVNDIKTN